MEQAQKSLRSDVLASIGAMFSGASREGADSSSIVTLVSGAIREGADHDKADSSGTSQKGAAKPITTPAAPFLAFPSDPSQRFKLSDLHFSGNEEDSRAFDFPSSPPPASFVIRASSPLFINSSYAAV